MTSPEWRPTRICPGTPSLQHLRIHMRLANHRLQKVCIRQRPGNHACWWRLINSGRGAKQTHINRKWIPSDLEVKAQHYNSSFCSLPPQQQASWTWAESQPQQQNLVLLFRFQTPRSHVGQDAHVPLIPWVT